MRKFFTILLVSIMALGSAWAQTSLKGKIVSDDGQAVAGAKITLANQNISTTTNQNGEFALIYLEAMDEEIIVEAAGYVTDVQLVNLQDNQQNDLGELSLKTDVQKELQDEVVLLLSESDLNDDEGKSQSMSSGDNATNDVFNKNTGFAWSSVRYRQRGYEQKEELTYINGINFNGLERGTFSYSMIGGLNDASRNKDIANGIEANSFSFGGAGKSTNILMNATRYAQGWKVGLSGTNRTYKGRAYATYSSGLLNNGWAFVGSLAWRYSPLINRKGIIGEGQDYNSLGYFFSAEKKFNDDVSMSLVTFGAPTMRSQSGAVTQEVYDLTGSIYYNPYWGYQNGKMRNSRVVKSFDPTAIVSVDWKLNEVHNLKFALGYHYSFYSNSALTFYNATDPRPDYYRNLPSFLWDGQFDQNGQFITNDMNGNKFSGAYFYDDNQAYTGANGEYYSGRWIGPSVDQGAYQELENAWKNRDDAVTQINWDRLYATNYANNTLNPNGSARYMLERRHNDLQEGMFSFNYQNTDFSDIHLKITAGLEAKYSQGIHYKSVDDLLGGNQWIDVDPFADRDMKDLASNIGLTQSQIDFVKQNDYNNPNAVKHTGDKFGYNYKMNMAQVAVWAQNEWNWTNVDLYYALKVTYSGMQRTSNMINGRALYLASLNDRSQASYYLGSNWNSILKAYDANQKLPSMSGYYYDFYDPSFKLGVTYKINARNRLKLNAIAETSAPLARDAYISPRVHDRVVNTMYRHANAKSLGDYYAASEKMAGGDLTYEFNYSWVRGRITGYYTRYWDGTELNGYYDDEARTFVNQSLVGIGRRHCGIEAAASFKAGNYITLTPMLAIGDYRYTTNAYSVTSAENGMALAEDYNDPNNIKPLYELKDSVLIRGLRVATGPQLNASLKISFFHPKMWFADLTISYFDWSYLDYAPSRRMKGLYTGVRSDGTKVNGSYMSPNPSTDSYSPSNYGYSESYSAVVRDENGEIVTDNYGIPQLKYPYNLMADQESLVNRNVWNRFMIDASIGKLIYLPKRQSLSINLSVSNLTNNTGMKTGGYQQARLPRQNIQKTQKPEASAITANAWKFPSKYYYAWGVNFYLSVTYKF